MAQNEPQRKETPPGPSPKSPSLLFEYQCTSGKFIRLANRIETFCPNWNALLQRSCSDVDYTYCSLPLWLGRTPLQRQKHTAVSYDFMLPTVILIIITGIPSPTHSFIPD